MYATMNMLHCKRIAGLWLAACIFGAGPAAALSAEPESLAALRAMDQQVATIGYRIATAAASLCPDRQWHPGLVVHDLSQYSRAGRAQAAATFRLDAGPGVLAVAQGGPAARAGLKPDDILIAADGVPLPRAPSEAHDTFAPTERILDALETAFADGGAELEILRNGRRDTIRVDGVPGCASRFQLIPSSQYFARADGRYVQLSTAMAAFARNDDELAALIAHELAHNILRHRSRLDQAGVERGRRTATGRSARLFRQTEIEADRWTVHLMDRAGFDPRAAVRLWGRQGRTIMAVVTGGRHPDWKTRIAAMESEIEAIAKARAGGVQAAPPFFEGALDGSRSGRAPGGD